MKKLLALPVIVSTFFLVACAAKSPVTATHDPFPMAKGPHQVNAIAVLPIGNDLANVLGIELAKRGFAVATVESMNGIVTGEDLKAASDLHIPGRVSPSDVERLMNHFQTARVDAILVLKADGFAPRRFRQYEYWQTVDVHLYTTRPDTKGPAHSYWGWVNTDNARARSALEGAAEIVRLMAKFVSNPL